MHHVAQLGSAIFLGCCANSGSINERLQLEFLYVNTSGFIVGFYFYYYYYCHCLWRICFFFYSSYFETRKKLTWKTCSSCCTGTDPSRARCRQSSAEARAVVCRCGVFSSPGLTVRSEVELCASGCNLISTAWLDALNCCVYMWHMGSEALLWTAVTVWRISTPTFIHRHRKTISLLDWQSCRG